MSMELREERRRRETEQRRLAQQRLERGGDVKAVASRPEGKRLLRRLLEDGDLFNPAWTPGAEGAYMAGKKAQALALWRLLREALSPVECLELLLPETGSVGLSPEYSGEAD